MGEKRTQPGNKMPVTTSRPNINGHHPRNQMKNHPRSNRKQVQIQDILGSRYAGKGGNAQDRILSLCSDSMGV